MLQMLLASGNIVDAIIRVGSIEPDDVSSVVMVIADFLHNLVNKHKRSTENGRTIVEQSSITHHISYLRWAGINIRPSKQNCLFDFFQSAIIPTLQFYDIDFNIVIDTSIECCSCKKVNTLDRQTWSCILITQATVEGNLEDVMGKLFGPTSRKITCSECFTDSSHRSSLSLMNCPKNLFLRFHPTTTTDHKGHKLSSHIDLNKIVSNNILRTRSYSRYTLQSFVTHDGVDDAGHYVAFARKKTDWYRLNDTNISLLKPFSLFGDHAERQPVVFAHFVRPSNVDIFSQALWNVFTNFTRCDSTLLPTLSLNDAVVYFARVPLIKNNPLNLAVVKRFQCPNCRNGMIRLVQRFHLKSFEYLEDLAAFVLGLQLEIHRFMELDLV